MGKLLVCVAENGHSYVLNCVGYALVEAVQRYLESVCGIPFNDQLLLCSDMKLESQRALSTYKLPSDDREVFLFNKARMRSNSPLPASEQVEIINIPDPSSPSSSQDRHPLDDASDPAVIALASYERQFRHHFQCGHTVYNRTLKKIQACERLLREQKVQERALDIARGNLDRFYRIVLHNYRDFMKGYSQQHRIHKSLLVNFGKDMDKLKSVKLLPTLQSDNRKYLVDFIKEESLQKAVKECSSSHRQFEIKVLEFKKEFGDLKHNAESLFIARTPFLDKDLDLAIRGHRQFVNEQESIMQALRKDVNTVKKLVDDCLSSKLSSSLRPHDAVSALGPMYDSHESYLPKMQACEREISSLLAFFRDKKNEMNMFVHKYMQSIAYIQYIIKDVRYKFSVFQEALKHQDDLFDHLKVARGIGPAYRACLAEVVRRKEAMKIYMGKAGQLAEKLAVERDTEVGRREEFLLVHNIYIPQDILASMGLYDMPNPFDVNVTPFDSNLLDIDITDVDRYAPESLFGHGALRTSFSMPNNGSRLSEGEGSATMEFHEKNDVFCEGSELVEIPGTSKMEVENAKLKAELASKIALLCSMNIELGCESPDDHNLDSILKNAAEKTSEALQLKDEYAKHLQLMLKVKQMQCESFEKRIHELEQRLSDHYPRRCDEDVCDSAVSTTKTDIKSDVSGAGEIHTAHVMEEVLCDSMAYSSAGLNPQLESSMLDLQCDNGSLLDKDKKETALSDDGGASNMAVSMSKLVNITNITEKSSRIVDAEKKIEVLTGEVSNLERELDVSRKVIDESQTNCAHLENCLREARKEAQTHLCAANQRGSEYSTLCVSAVRMRSLFGSLRSCVSSPGLETFPVSLRALAESLSSNSNVDDEDGFAGFHECVQALADKVDALFGQYTESVEKGEATNVKLIKELEEKNKLVNTLYTKHQMEKQVNKGRISFGRLEVREIAAFILNSSGYYEAINRSCPYYYLSAESVALFTDNILSHPSYIIGQIVHIERQTVKPPRMTSPNNESSDIRTSEFGTYRNAVSTSNPYCLPVGCEYFVVTIAMVPGMSMQSTPS